MLVLFDAALRTAGLAGVDLHHSVRADLLAAAEREGRLTPEIARLHSFAFNILKANRTNTLNQDRCRAALADLTHLLSIIRIPER